MAAVLGRKPDFDLGFGRILATKTTIDSAGRLVIPKEIREEAGLKPGALVEVRWRSGRIEIEPAPLPVNLVRKGRLTVRRRGRFERGAKPPSERLARKSG